MSSGTSTSTREDFDDSGKPATASKKCYVGGAIRLNWVNPSKHLGLLVVQIQVTHATEQNNARRTIAR
jgi:hypothetical protein